MSNKSLQCARAFSHSSQDTITSDRGPEAASAVFLSVTPPLLLGPWKAIYTTWNWGTRDYQGLTCYYQDPASRKQEVYLSYTEIWTK